VSSVHKNTHAAKLQTSNYKCITTVAGNQLCEQRFIFSNSRDPKAVTDSPWAWNRPPSLPMEEGLMMVIFEKGKPSRS